VGSALRGSVCCFWFGEILIYISKHCLLALVASNKCITLDCFPTSSDFCPLGGLTGWKGIIFCVRLSRRGCSLLIVCSVCYIGVLLFLHSAGAGFFSLFYPWLVFGSRFRHLALRGLVTPSIAYQHCNSCYVVLPCGVLGCFSLAFWGLRSTCRFSMTRSVDVRELAACVLYLCRIWISLYFLGRFGVTMVLPCLAQLLVGFPFYCSLWAAMGSCTVFQPLGLLVCRIHFVDVRLFSQRPYCRTFGVPLLIFIRWLVNRMLDCPILAVTMLVTLCHALLSVGYWLSADIWDDLHTF